VAVINLVEAQYYGDKALSRRPQRDDGGDGNNGNVAVVVNVVDDRSQNGHYHCRENPVHYLKYLLGCDWQVFEQAHQQNDKRNEAEHQIKA
jgi:hypothetical protein